MRKPVTGVAESSFDFTKNPTVPTFLLTGFLILDPDCTSPVGKVDFFLVSNAYFSGEVGEMFLSKRKTND